MLNPSPSSLPDESSLSELEPLNTIGSDALEEVVDDASSCKSSSSLKGNSSRWAIRHMFFPSISKSRSIQSKMKRKNDYTSLNTFKNGYEFGLSDTTRSQMGGKVEN